MYLILQEIVLQCTIIPLNIVLVLIWSIPWFIFFKDFVTDISNYASYTNNDPSR